MDIIKKILAPTDLSPFSAKGVRYACDLAKALQAQPTIAHVFQQAGVSNLVQNLERSLGSTTSPPPRVKINFPSSHR